jgi:hypothetical protein
LAGQSTGAQLCIIVTTSVTPIEVRVVRSGNTRFHSWRLSQNSFYGIFNYSVSTNANKYLLQNMAMFVLKIILSSGMWRRVDLARIDVSEEHIASIISVLQLLVTADVPSSLILFTLMKDAIRYSETSVLTRATRRHNLEDGILLVTAVKTSNFTLFRKVYNRFCTRSIFSTHCSHRIDNFLHT